MNPYDHQHCMPQVTQLTQQLSSEQPQQLGEARSSTVMNPSAPSFHFTGDSNRARSPQSPYYSPPSTWMPPVSPDIPRQPTQDSPGSLGARPIRTQTRVFEEHDYGGVTLAPGQLGSLTAIGQFSSNAANSIDSASHTSSLQGPTVSPSSHVNPSIAGQSQKATANSRLPDSNSQPSLGGRMTFPELARENGIRGWNNSNFDDRWLLHEDEMWNVDARRTSVMTMSPGCPPAQLSSWQAQVQPEAQAQVAAAQAQLKPERESLDKSIMLRRAKRRQAAGEDVDQTYDPLAGYAALVGIGPPKAKPKTSIPALDQYPTSTPELKRLTRLFNEYMDTNFLMPMGLPFPREAVREYLRDRIFGPAATRTLSEADAAKIVLYGGNLIARGVLREHLASVVNIMAKEMTSTFGLDMIRDANDFVVSGRTPPGNTSIRVAFPTDFATIHHSLEMRRMRRENNVNQIQMREGSPQKQANGTPPMPMAYSGAAMTQYSQPPRYANFQPYYKYPTDVGYGIPQPYMPQFGAPQGVPTLHYQQLFGSPFQFQAPNVYTSGGRYPMQYPLVQSMHGLIPGPPQGTRPAAPQRLAPNALRAGALGLDQLGIDVPGRGATQARSESAQPKQESSSSAQSTNTQLPQPSAYSRGLEPAQPAQPSRLPTESKSAQLQLPMNHPAPIGPSASVPIAHNPEWGIRYSSPTTITPGVPSLPYYPGSDITKPKVMGGSIINYHDLTRHGKPSYTIAVNKAICPFVESAKESKPAPWGVIKIGNIPYSLTKGEVVAFLGRNAKIVSPELGSPIHIIMDRSTGKTMDCYVEFFSVGDAQATLNKLTSRGHSLKLGTPPHDRVVGVELSTQEALLKELFPRAKNVVWRNGKPVIEESTEPFNTGFKAFVTGEELVMMVRHAEQPHRSGYTQKCPQRTYETMISTLYKFPWHSAENYTITARNQIFAAVQDLIKILMINLKRGGAPNITQNLLTELIFAGLNAPGFSEKQRWLLVEAAEYAGDEVKLSPLMKWWPWETLGRKPGSEEDVVEYYAYLFNSHPATVNTPSSSDTNVNNPFGALASTAPVELDTITMEEMGHVEWDQFRTLLSDILQ